jgi:folate-binding protein YgfZ
MPLHPDIACTDDELERFRTGAHVVPIADAVFRLEGTGTIDCLQGILTNDVTRMSGGSAMWGALLTAKGMIITDAWVLRDGTAAWLLAPGTARDTLQQLLARTIPPRLSRVTDHSDALRVHWFLGHSAPLHDSAGLFTPQTIAPFTAVALRAADAAPFDAPWTPAPASFAELAKLRLGWPTLGREIDAKTLPQEVRFDELDGVRYDKGCYTGQETVARLHFRGHANRVLRGVCWAPGDAPSSRDVSDGVKTVGTLRTVAQLGDRAMALAVLRREVALGDTVRTGSSEGVVVDPPLDWSDLTVA